MTFYEVLDRDRLGKAGMNGIMGCFFVLAGFTLMAGLEAMGKGSCLLFSNLNLIDLKCRRSRTCWTLTMIKVLVSCNTESSVTFVLLSPPRELVGA